jgi:hypothetical protein
MFLSSFSKLSEKHLFSGKISSLDGFESIIAILPLKPKTTPNPDLAVREIAETSQNNGPSDT